LPGDLLKINKLSDQSKGEGGIGPIRQKKTGGGGGKRFNANGKTPKGRGFKGGRVGSGTTKGSRKTNQCRSTRDRKSNDHGKEGEKTRG